MLLNSSSVPNGAERFSCLVSVYRGHPIFKLEKREKSTGKRDEKKFFRDEFCAKMIASSLRRGVVFEKGTSALQNVRR